PARSATARCGSSRSRTSHASAPASTATPPSDRERSTSRMTSDPASDDAREQAEAPHPAPGVRGLRDELLSIATGLTGPGRSGLARRSAVGQRFTERLGGLFEHATEGVAPSGTALAAVGSLGRGELGP